LFIILRVTTLLGSLLRVAPPRIAAQLYDTPLSSTICFLLRVSPHRIAPLHSSTQRFVSDNALLRFAPTRLAALRPASPHNSTQRFVFYAVPQLCTAHRSAPQLCSTQRFVCFFASHRNAALHTALHRSTALLNSTICLFLRAATRLFSALHSSSPLSATQLNVIAIYRRT